MSESTKQQLVDRALDAILYTIGDQEDGTPNVALFRQRGRIRSVLVQFGIALTESNNSRPAPAPCTSCRGHLVVPGSVLGSPEDCGRCNGTGNEPTPCAPCKGSGYGPNAAHDGLPCPECDGSGWQASDPFADSREGMVSVHDHTGKCVGSVGAETWAEMTRETDEVRVASMNDWRTRCLKAEALLDQKETIQTTELRQVREELAAVKATLDASEDPAVSWQRAANRAETQAKALQGELKALLKLVLEARLEHTCADHSHETRWGCPECRLVDHMDRRGWESLEAVQDA